MRVGTSSSSSRPGPSCRGRGPGQKLIFDGVHPGDSPRCSPPPGGEPHHWKDRALPCEEERCGRPGPAGRGALGATLSSPTSTFPLRLCTLRRPVASWRSRRGSRVSLSERVAVLSPFIIPHPRSGSRWLREIKFSLVERALGPLHGPSTPVIDVDGVRNPLGMARDFSGLEHAAWTVVVARYEARSHHQRMEATRGRGGRLAAQHRGSMSEAAQTSDSGEGGSSSWPPSSWEPRWASWGGAACGVCKRRCPLVPLGGVPGCLTGPGSPGSGGSGPS